MSLTLPLTIENHLGEKKIFHRVEMQGAEETLIMENFLAPNGGLFMHTLYKQDQSLTVLRGRMGYQFMGEAPRYASVGETVIFQKGQAHRYWNAGDTELNCFGWIRPACNTVFIHTAFYHALNESGREKPEQFDGAYLLYRYRNEFARPELPGFVRTVVIPATYKLGKLTGRYKKFRDAPAPLP